MSLQRYRDLAQEAESSVEYWTDVAVNDFARELHELMKRRNVSNAELARRLGVERQYISKLLGGANVTLQTMVKLAVALDGVVRVRLEQRDDRKADAGVVVEFAPGEPPPAETEEEPKPKRRRG
ncbi:MAG TPA: helix-turn-helix transcriptional regulator [Thermoanaerobaculia bacterium]|nr:helix-turn-helix transcriptional regulator [Thermoanaerobaculia bacterium]